jgi:MarR family transcriptional regulator, organic hydroperoxide resistance regulator
MVTKAQAAARVTTEPGDVARDFDYPLERSIGYQLRRTYRYFAQDLQIHLASYDIPIGMWYFLRALWQEDGLTQRELSERVGSMAPTTVEQLRNMENRGLVERRRSGEDRRKIHVFLTPEGRALKARLLPYAEEVNEIALDGLSDGEIGFLRLVLRRMQENIARRHGRIAATAAPAPAMQDAAGRRQRAR